MNLDGRQILKIILIAGLTYIAIMLICTIFTLYNFIEDIQTPLNQMDSIINSVK